jgi:hypothetical protein
LTSEDVSASGLGRRRWLCDWSGTGGSVGVLGVLGVIVLVIFFAINLLVVVISRLSDGGSSGWFGDTS